MALYTHFREYLVLHDASARSNQRKGYFYYICAGAQQSAFFSIHRVQNLLSELVDDFLPYNTFPHRRNVSSLSLVYRYFPENCSVGLHALVLSVKNFTAQTCHSIKTRANHFHPLHVPTVRKQTTSY